jgi:hypothetical protein
VTWLPIFCGYGWSQAAGSTNAQFASGTEPGSIQHPVDGEYKNHKNRPKMRYHRGMYDFAGKSFCSRLRDFGCPDTLIKDVRDVAAAVMCSEGSGRSERKLNRSGI